MGNCKYCGQKAGLLSSSHKECEATYINGKKQIADKVAMAIADKTDFSHLNSEAQKIATDSFIKKEELADLYSLGFDQSVEGFLEDGVLSPEEEQRLTDFRGHFNFDQSVLDKRGSMQKIVKALILRDVMDGKIPESRLNIQGQLPFLFQKDETMIWLFQDVELFEQKTTTTYRGGSQGVSVKVAKGVYYRMGTFKGSFDKSEETISQGAGILVITNKHIYFSSAGKTFKTPYTKIVSLIPYSDGIGIQKDGVTAKPQTFKGIDGWFTYNLISNLNQL